MTLWSGQVSVCATDIIIYEYYLKDKTGHFVKTCHVRSDGGILSIEMNKYVLYRINDL